MKHRIKGRKLSRTASHRKATLNALATALFRHKKIKTTIAKAKEAATYAERLITKAKTDSVHTRRQVARFIKDKDVVKELYGEIIPKVGDRPGGYTRVIKLGHRLGDAAEMAILELVDYNEIIPKEKPAAKKVEEKPAEEKTEEPKEEVKAEEEPKAEAKEEAEEVTEEKSSDDKEKEEK